VGPCRVVDDLVMNGAYRSAPGGRLLAGRGDKAEVLAAERESRTDPIKSRG